MDVEALIERAKEEGWRGLNLRDRDLTELPDTLWELTVLESLDLSGNRLTELPAAIGQLVGLRSLVLGRWDEDHIEGWRGNQLTQLPAEVSQLSNLTELYFSRNQLTQLPTEVAQLTNLTKLDLRGNQLTQLPAEIGALTKLTTLDLSNNQLTQLPAEFTALTKLRRLDLRGNQLPIPLEILETTYRPTAILNFYTEYLAGQKKPLNEAKLLIVGQGSVGKTSLVNRLLHNRFNPQENKTEGIDIQPWQVGNIQLNVWDFGGQEIMHATHQFFLTKRSLYLLVLDTRQADVENRLEYWLKIIQSFGDESPIIVVGNKSDQQPLYLDRRGLQLKYPSIKTFIETSCQSGQGISDLKAAITEHINQMEHIKDELPLSWFELKTQIEDMEQDYIPYPEYMQLCQEKGINEQSQQTLIGFLHDLGVVLNFRDDPRLEDTNILNPVWVTNGVYQILNDRALMLDHKGILDRSMLSRILDSKRYPKSKQLFIIDMMRKFELCFDLESDKKFLIPDLLSKEEPDTGQWDSALAFQYHYNVLPGSIISRFIVRANQLISRKTYWRSGAVLAHEGSRALVKADREDKKIFIWVTGSEGTRRRLLSIIRSNFAHIHRTITGIEVKEMVPLPEHPDITVSYKHLLNLERKNVQSFIPEDSENSVNVKQLLDGVEPMRSHSEQERNPSITRIENQNIFNAPVASVGNEGNQTNVAGTVKGDQIATQNNISQSVTKSPGSNINAIQGNENQVAQEQLSKEDILDLLTQIKTLIADSGIPSEVKIAANANLQVAQKATEQETPKKEIALATLESMAETLEEASKSVEAGKTLWNQVSPIAVKVARWLGAAVGSLLMGL